LPLESVTESEPLGTAGPLLLIPNLVDRHFLVVNGDVLTTLDFRKVFAAHTSSRAVAIVCTAKISTPIDYGPDGKVKQYAEKPVLEHHVSMGINVLSQKSLAFIPPNVRWNMPDLINAMAAAGLPSVGYSAECYWNDIGRESDCQRAVSDFLSNPAMFLPSTVKQ
jgi:NDP-sugar pyrophosphorylase family protein